MFVESLLSSEDVWYTDAANVAVAGLHLHHWDSSFDLLVGYQ